MSVFLIDTIDGLGGGQVVLNSLAFELRKSNVDFSMIRERNVVKDLQDVFRASHSGFGKIKNRIDKRVSVVLVANANRSLPYAIFLKSCLLFSGRKTKVVFLAHSYPKNTFSRVLLMGMSAFVSCTICVEPGLQKAFFRTLDAPILVTTEIDSDVVSNELRETKIVTYQRADPVKGGLRLAPLFTELSELGFTCRVALDKSLDGDIEYETRLRKSVALWLEDGRRSASWLRYGDIYLCTSYSEAVALSVQEAILRGCFVISSNVGVLPLLGANVPAIKLVEHWNTGEVIEFAEQIAAMTAAEKRICIEKSQESLKAMSGMWLKFVTQVISTATRV